MKATRKNISEVLRTNAKGLEFRKAPADNGFQIIGFLKRSALTDLMNNFHCYINKKAILTVITPGMESTKDRL